MTTIVLIGYGGRGQDYSAYAKKFPDKMKITAVAEPRKFLRDAAAKEFSIPPENVFETYEELLSHPPLGEGVFITTQDNDHVTPAIRAMEAGYRHLMVEKPIDHDMEECIRLAKAAREFGAGVQICHTLRYTPFYRKMKEIVDSGVLGEIIHINQEEEVGYYHYAHSFVRGDWRREEDSSPMILAKCCHDMDMIYYLMGSTPTSLSSMGELSYFKEENAPKGSTARCIDCPVKECPYSAMTIYSNLSNFYRMGVTKEGYTDLETAMREGRYGRCVYRCDNTVVDHQSVNIHFENGSTATLTMNPFSHLINRETHILGTMGELYGNMEDSIIRVYPFGKEPVEYTISHAETNHSGGDEVLSGDFVKSIRGEASACTSHKRGREPSRPQKTAEPLAPFARWERSSSLGFSTTCIPVPVIRKTPSSLTEPKRFLTARSRR